MKKVILVAMGLASVALVGCVDYKGVKNISLSGQMYWDATAGSIKVNTSSVPGIVTATPTTSATATPLYTTISGSATASPACMAEIFPQDSDGNDRIDELSPTETSFTTYVDGGTDGDTYLYEIIYVSDPGVCSGLTLNTNISFNINSSQYTGSFSHTFI